MPISSWDSHGKVAKVVGLTIKSKKSPRAAICHIGRVLAAGAAIFCAGCQAYQPKPLDPGATAIRFDKRRLDDPQLRSAIVSSGHWSHGRGWPPAPWKLRELQGAALYYHPEIAVAKAKAITARAGIQTADTARIRRLLSFLNLVIPAGVSRHGSSVSPSTYPLRQRTSVANAPPKPEPFQMAPHSPSRTPLGPCRPLSVPHCWS